MMMMMIIKCHQGAEVFMLISDRWHDLLQTMLLQKVSNGQH